MLCIHSNNNNNNNASLLLLRAMELGVLKPAGFFPFGLTPVLWHRTPEVEALGRHLWEAKHNPGEVQCQSSPKQSMQFGLVTLYMYYVYSLLNSDVACYTL